MKAIKPNRIILALDVAVAVAVAVVSLAHAQSNPPVDHAAHHAEPSTTDAQALQSEGEVRKVNRESGKLTLRHGPLANLDMPAMTMVFAVAESRFLDDLNEGDKVRFTADKKDGKFVVTAIQRTN